MGYLRQGQPAALDRAGLTTIVSRVVAEELETLPVSSFRVGIVHGCCNPKGHDFVADCGGIICLHCGSVAWQ